MTQGLEASLSKSVQEVKGKMNDTGIAAVASETSVKVHFSERTRTVSGLSCRL